MTEAELEIELEQEVMKYTLDPKGYDRFAYPWGDGELEESWAASLAR